MHHVRPPTRLRFALQQAQLSLCRAITHPLHLNRFESAAPRQLAPLGLACGGRLGRELRSLFRNHDWISSGLGLRPSRIRHLPILKANAKTEADQTQSGNRKVSTFARVGERGRALPAARNAPFQSQPRSHTKSKGLHPADPGPMVKRAAQVSHIFTAEVAEFFPLLVTAQAGAVAVCQRSEKIDTCWSLCRCCGAFRPRGGGVRDDTDDLRKGSCNCR